MATDAICVGDDTPCGFDALPRRIFLDSSVIQTLHHYGDCIWEEQEAPPGDRICASPDGPKEIEALRAIFRVNERAMFEFALSAHSLEEVAEKRDKRYLQWAFDILDHCQACLEAYQGSAFAGTGSSLATRLEEPRFGYLSTKDRLLMGDAVKLECDAFLTMDRKLAKNADHLHRELRLQVLLPSHHWGLLRRWAALYL